MMDMELEINIKSFIKSVKKIEFDNLKKLNSSFYDSIYSTKVIEAVNQSLNKIVKLFLLNDKYKI